MKVVYRSVVPYFRMATLLRADLQAFIEKLHVDFLEFFEKKPELKKKAHIDDATLLALRNGTKSLLEAKFDAPKRFADGRIELHFTLDFDDVFLNVNDRLRKTFFGLGKIVFPSVKDIARQIADTIRHDYRGVVDYEVIE